MLRRNHLEKSEIKGFALLGRATTNRLENYQAHWDGLVDFNIRPIKEIHLFLQAQADKLEPELKEASFEKIIQARRLEAKLLPENVRKWSTNRKYVAKWSIDPAKLLEVIDRWLEYKQKKLEDILKYGPIHSEQHQLPEYNGDYEG
jgi:hypothetical protein